jgi:gas vesicle protein
MADGYDRYDSDSAGGGSFVMGLLTGTVLGAGLGMLFAPKAGSELRGQLQEQAGTIANSASEGYRRASEAASDWAGRGRDVYDKAKDAVNRGAEEAQRYARESTSGAQTGSGMGSGTTGSGSGFGTSPSSGESMRGRETGTPAYGSGIDQTRGGQTNQSGVSGPGSSSTGPTGGTRRS